MALTEKEKAEIEAEFGIKIEELSDEEKEKRKKEIEDFCEEIRNSEDYKEYEEKENKLKELKEKYKQKFGEEIEYYMFDVDLFLSLYNEDVGDKIDNEIKFVENALKDDEPFEPAEDTDIYFRGHKLDWFD